MNTCEVCEKPIPRTMKVCEECEKGAPAPEVPKEEEKHSKEEGCEFEEDDGGERGDE